MVSTRQLKIYDNMIRQIYGSTNSKNISAAVLDCLSFLVPYDSAAIFMVKPGTHQFDMPLFSGLEEKHFEMYQNYYENKDEYKRVVFGQKRIPPVDRSSDYMNYGKWLKNEHRVDFLTPLRIHHLACVQVFNHDELAAMISLHRSTGSKDFNQQEMEILKLLHYHMNNALENTFLLYKHRLPGTYELTNRESQIALHIARGKTNLEIARQLFISENTVKTHIKRIFTKTGVKSRTELVFKLRSTGK